MQFESPQVKSSVNSDYESGRTDSSDSRMETSFESRNTFGSYDGRSMSPEWDSKKVCTHVIHHLTCGVQFDLKILCSDLQPSSTLVAVLLPLTLQALKYAYRNKEIKAFFQFDNLKSP